jgi:hypothetical protein
MAAKITDVESIKRFVRAGKAHFTLVSERTGQRFTYRVKVKKADDGQPSDFYFVSVLTGPDNNSSYTYLGCIRGDRWIDDRRMRIGAGAPSRRGFRWFWRNLMRGGDLSQVAVWHEGRCGRCRRKLTVPESIASGLGPTCAGM